MKKLRIRTGEGKMQKVRLNPLMCSLGNDGETITREEEYLQEREMELNLKESQKS